jgi:hypothetical protein
MTVTLTDIQVRIRDEWARCQVEDEVTGKLSDGPPLTPEVVLSIVQDLVDTLASERERASASS